MGWRDELRLQGGGSFRGAHFQVQKTEGTAGRRTVKHEYPGRDTPSVEDQGRAPREFNLTCYVIGEDYHVLRDLLRIEFETAGPGSLVHPLWGDFEVVVTSPVRIREMHDDEGGIARFDLQMVEVGDAELTVKLPDYSARIIRLETNALAKFASALNTALAVINTIERVRQEALDKIQAIGDTIEGVKKSINRALNIIDDTIKTVTKITQATIDVLTDPSILVGYMEDAAGSVFDSIKDIGSSIAELGEVFTGGGDGEVQALRTLEALTDINTFDADDTDPSVPQGGQDAISATNQAALENYSKRLMTVKAATTLTQLNYGSRQAVLDAKDAILTAIEDLLPDAEDEVYAALVDYRAQFVERMFELAQPLPDLVDHTPKEVLPALVIAFDLYGDVDRAPSMVARNKVSDPNAVPALELKVEAYGG